MHVKLIYIPQSHRGKKFEHTLIFHQEKLILKLILINLKSYAFNFNTSYLSSKIITLGSATFFHNRNLTTYMSTLTLQSIH